MRTPIDEAILGRLKDYMLEYHDEDERIWRMYLRVAAYFAEFGVEAPEEQEDSLYEQAVFAVTLEWHDQLGATTDERVAPLPLGARTVINRLKISAQVAQAVSNLDTGEVTP